MLQQDLDDAAAELMERAPAAKKNIHPDSELEELARESGRIFPILFDYYFSASYFGKPYPLPAGMTDTFTLKDRSKRVLAMAYQALRSEKAHDAIQSDRIFATRVCSFLPSFLIQHLTLTPDSVCLSPPLCKGQYGQGSCREPRTCFRF